MKKGDIIKVLRKGLLSTKRTSRLVTSLRKVIIADESQPKIFEIFEKKC